MIEHGGRTFNDDKLRPYGFTRRLVHNWKEDECEIYIVYGTPEGIGKSAYVNHVLADLHGYFNCKDKEKLAVMWKSSEQTIGLERWPTNWEAPKSFNLYLPKEVVEKCLYMLDNDMIDVAVHWDDGGTWLYLMEYHDPFVVAFMEYLTLARTNWKGGIIISTPVKDWILKRLHTAEGIIQVKVTRKEDTNYEYRWKPRTAKAYMKVRHPGVNKSYFPRQWVDHFSGIMPDSFYKWYKPRRDRYAKIAALKMRKAVQSRKTKGWNVEEAEEILEQMESHIFKANDIAPELREAVAQHQN